MELVIVAIGSSYMGATIPVCLVVAVGITYFYLRTSKRLRVLDLEAKTPLFRHFATTISGLATLRASGWQARFQSILDEALDHSQSPFHLMFCIQSWLRVATNMLVMAIAIVLVALATQVQVGSHAASFGLAMTNLIGLSQAVAELVQSWTLMETSLGAVARTKHLLQTSLSEDQLEQTGEDPSPNWPQHGGLEIKNVSLSYRWDNAANVSRYH